jgi:hypothetical protein
MLMPNRLMNNFWRNRLRIEALSKVAKVGRRFVETSDRSFRNKVTILLKEEGREERCP